jgi:hypothetical protein
MGCKPQGNRDSNPKFSKLPFLAPARFQDLPTDDRRVRLPWAGGCRIINAAYRAFGPKSKICAYEPDDHLIQFEDTLIAELRMLSPRLSAPTRKA